MRASKLIGTRVNNEAGERIGEVNEIVLSKDGEVAAVVIGVGAKPRSLRHEQGQVASVGVRYFSADDASLQHSQDLITRVGGRRSGRRCPGTGRPLPEQNVGVIAQGIGPSCRGCAAGDPCTELGAASH
jgi:sporulation protein YlmC with PRC-barrel domain